MAEYVDFDEGSIHVATVKFTNTKGLSINLTGELYLAYESALAVPVNTPVIKSFTVPALGEVNVTFDNIVIPWLTSVASVTLVACVRVSSEGIPIAVFTGSQLVRILYVSGIGWGGFTWS